VKNPFSDFRSVPYRKKEFPLDRIVRARQEVMDRMVAGYLHLVEEEVKELVWLVEHSRVVRAYNAAVAQVEGIGYDQDDIEDFCAEMDGSTKVPYMISGPAGIFLSALINHASEDHLVLGLRDFEKSFHFLGYRLPEGKTLVLQGNLGDFIGSGLSGGRLIVEGSTGNWCGAGMMKGEVLITGSTGQKTGEWMQGGEIRVDGRIAGIGKSRFGGRIYQREKLIVHR
jgi:formylmethanofuran dehydrogenase subunit C